MPLEHINITSSDPEGFTDRICAIFDWKVRWRGESIHGGETIHVGDDMSYLAVYIPPKSTDTDDPKRFQPARINHIGIVVDDLDATEEKVKALGIHPHEHADYEPGRRFYFYDPSGVEIEVVSYAKFLPSS